MKIYAHTETNHFGYYMLQHFFYILHNYYFIKLKSQTEYIFEISISLHKIEQLPKKLYSFQKEERTRNFFVKSKTSVNSTLKKYA